MFLSINECGIRFHYFVSRSSLIYIQFVARFSFAIIRDQYSGNLELYLITKNFQF